MKLNAQQLRTLPMDPEIAKSIRKNPITIILDNVLDTYNVGAIFRLADAVAAQKIYLCGETETPPNPKIKKASINTWQWVDWEYAPSAVSAILDVKSTEKMIKVIAVEQHKSSVPLSQLTVELPTVVVVGNESYGVSKDVLDIADVIVELPMFGINTSLNVMVTCAIVLYRIVETSGISTKRCG